MEEPATGRASAGRGIGPAWASCLGVVAVILGMLLTASHGNELMRQAVVTPLTSADAPPPEPDCPEDELEEEGISLAECEQMAHGVQDIILSRPDWFRGYQITLSAAGTVLAFLSIFIGAALVNYRRWAPAAAIVTFGALMAVDGLGFIGAVNTGPIMRAMYLWNMLLWFTIHMMMTVGAIVGRQQDRTA